ncbi:NACHT domain-containing protein [Streptomyces sp. NPDC005898]|uniref:NACHT domain-containing protein n=1 Tax=Streptomyces sp. NPDC005898 TaxID=3157082 RepID=UPI0033DDA3DB
MRDRMLKWSGAALFLALMLGAIIYLWTGPLERADQAASVVSSLVALLGVPPAVVVLWQLWHRRPATSRSVLEEAAGQLAVALRNQWDAEAAVRRINDPYPLPVAWQPADSELQEPWTHLEELARSWPGGPPGDPARWPRDVAGLAGQDGAIGEIFTDRVPTRRLVILGEPGSGKSVLLIRLLQDLLARRTDGEPVPVLFSLASWDPHQPLQRWLADQLRHSHPGLREAATATTDRSRPGDLAEALLETGRILPLLDGFDELPLHLHPFGLDALNRALSARRPLVLTTRSDAYRAALTGPGTALRLNGAAAIRLLPLDAAQAAAYLRRDTGGPHTPGAARWNAVIDQLGTAGPVSQALSTPLGLFLARTIYNPRPSTDLHHTAPHPDELCDTAAFPDRAAVDRHLFHAFIPAAYTPHGPRPPRWSPEQALRAFTFLARFQESHCHSSPDLAWWELRRAVPSTIRRLIGGLVLGLVGAFAGVVGGWSTVKALAVVTGGTAGAIMGRRIYGSVGAVPLGLIGVTVGGLVLMLAETLMWTVPLLLGAYQPEVSGRTGLLTGIMLGCLMFHPAKRPSSPRVGMRQLRDALVGGLWVLVLFLTLAVLWLRVDYDLVGVLVGGLAGGLTGEITGRCLRRQAGGLTPGFLGGMAGILPLNVYSATFALSQTAQSVALYLIPLVGALAGGALATGMRGPTPRTPDLTSNVGPTRLFDSDRRAILVLSAVFAPMAGAVFGFIFGTDFGGEFGFPGEPAWIDLSVRIKVGFVVAAAVAFAFGTVATAWPHFLVAQTYLAVHRQIPRDLMAFLQDAHEHRGILRQVGPVYQFRHIDLQRHLAQQH